MFVFDFGDTTKAAHGETSAAASLLAIQNEGAEVFEQIEQEGEEEEGGFVEDTLVDSGVEAFQACLQREQDENDCEGEEEEDDFADDPLTGTHTGFDERDCADTLDDFASVECADTQLDSDHELGVVEHTQGKMKTPMDITGHRPSLERVFMSSRNLQLPMDGDNLLAMVKLVQTKITYAFQTYQENDLLRF
jgi:hypothetical protein